MSTTWYVPIPEKTRNAESAIRKMTGWKKFNDPEQLPIQKKIVQILTDGEFYIHCDRRPMTIVDHGKFACLERYNENYPLEEILEQLDGFSEYNDNTVINCDNCGRYMMSDETHVDDRNEMVICRICAGLPEKS